MENSKSEEKKAWMIGAAAIISFIVGVVAMMVTDKYITVFPSGDEYIRLPWGAEYLLPCDPTYIIFAIIIGVFTLLCILISKEYWKHFVTISFSLTVAIIVMTTLYDKDIVTSLFGSMCVFIIVMVALFTPFFIWFDWIPQDGKKKNLRTFCEEFQVFKRTKKAIKTTAQVLAVIVVWYGIAIGLYLAGESPEAHGLIGILLQCAGSLMILLPILFFIP